MEAATHETDREPPSTTFVRLMQAECQAMQARSAAIGKDEALSERIWRTTSSKGLSESKTSLNDLLRAWKGVSLCAWFDALWTSPTCAQSWWSAPHQQRMV